MTFAGRARHEEGGGGGEAGSLAGCGAGRTLSWPPTSHTVNEMFLYSTVSTLKPARSWRGTRWR